MPRVGATAEDVPQVFDMVTGGNPSHYWEDSGQIGYLYQDRLGIDVYGYDIWMVYEPGIKWTDKNPPKPSYWMHNLWGVSDEQAPRLDSKIFAEKVNELLESTNH